MRTQMLTRVASGQNKSDNNNLMITLTGGFLLCLAQVQLDQQ